MTKIKTEVCVGSFEDAKAAQAAGADRVELNSAVFLGGLTPSLGAVMQCKEVLSIEILPMVRPRSGGFLYSADDYTTMLQDAKLFLEQGVDGLVFGFLNADATIDETRTRTFVELAKATGKTAVFHRAFDLVPDPETALETLIACGVDRVLTSGLAPSAPEGIEVIKALVEQARGRIEILPGAGIRPTNAANMVSYTGVNQLHFTAFSVAEDPTGLGRPQVHFGGALYPSETEVKVTDVTKVRALINSIH